MDNKSKHITTLNGSRVRHYCLELCGTLQEDEAFLRALGIYGSEDISAIQAAVQTRSKVQIRNRLVKVVSTVSNSNKLFEVICPFISLHFPSGG